MDALSCVIVFLIALALGIAAAVAHHRNDAPHVQAFPNDEDEESEE